MILRGLGGGRRKPGYPLLADAQVNLGAIAEFFAGAFQDALEDLLGALKFLLLEMFERFFVELQLLLPGGSFRIRRHYSGLSRS
jgi:hypothetical protein